MTGYSVQAPAAVVVVRPHRYRPNPETGDDNAFQQEASNDVARAAYDASSRLIRALRDVGVRVHVFEDTTGRHPDSVFPNN